MPACRQTKADWQSCPAGSWAVQRRTDAPPTCDNCAGGECAEWPGSTPQPLFTTHLQQVGDFVCVEATSCLTLCAHSCHQPALLHLTFL